MNRRFVEWSSALSLLAAGIALWAGSAQAASLTWNNGAGNMAWDTASANWGGTNLWNNTTPDSAVFGATGIGTVPLTEAITVGALTFNNSGYIIDPAGFALALKKTGDFAITVATDVTAEIVSANLENLAVTADTLKIGAGTLVLSGTSSALTRQISLRQGTLSVSSMAALGSGSLKTYSPGTTGLASRLLYTGSGETTGKSVTFDSDENNYVFTLDQSGTGLLKFSNFKAATRGQSGWNLVLQGSNTGSGEISSTVGAASGGGKTMKVTKNGANTWTLSGANTYTGATTINSGGGMLQFAKQVSSTTIPRQAGLRRTSSSTAAARSA
jgi:autotransporter-associated beta strand protein